MTSTGITDTCSAPMRDQDENDVEDDDDEFSRPDLERTQTANTVIEVLRGNTASDSASVRSSLKPAHKANKRILFPLLVLFALQSFGKNVSHAKTDGMNVALEITQNEWSGLLTTFYVGSILTIIPFLLFGVSNARLNSLQGSRDCIILSSILHGLVTALNSTSHSFVGILLIRLVQGACEAIILPTSIAYLLNFYTQAQMNSKMLWFFCTPALASSLGALYAFAIFHINHSHRYRLIASRRVGHGMQGWQYLYIGEGCSLVLWAFISWFILPAPSNKLPFKRGKAALPVEKRPLNELESISYLNVLSKPPNLAWMVMDLCLGLPTSIVFLYTPQLILRILAEDLKIDNEPLRNVLKANYLTIFPYLTSLGLFLLILYLSQRWEHRGLFLTLAFLAPFVGFSLYFATLRKKWSFGIGYFSIFLITSGLLLQPILASRWISSNLKPTKRTLDSTKMLDTFKETALAGTESEKLFLNTLGTILTLLSGIIGSWAFRGNFEGAIAGCLAACLIGALVSLFTVLGMLTVNRRVTKESKSIAAVDVETVNSISRTQQEAYRNPENTKSRDFATKTQKRPAHLVDQLWKL